MPHRALLPWFVSCLAVCHCPAQEDGPPPRSGAEHAVAVVDPRGLPGTRLLGGGGKLPAAIYQRFVELAGGPDAKIVLIPTASETADDPEANAARLADWRHDHPGVKFELLHTRDRREADREDFTAPLRSATGVWFGGGAQARLAQAYVGNRVETEVMALLARGGVVGGSSAGTAIQTRTMIQEGRDPPILATGLDLVPFAISDQHFLRRERLPRLLQALTLAPGHFGLGIDEGTAVLIRGRELSVLGNSQALLVLAPAAGHDERVVRLAAGDAADLVSWQRAARDRTRGAWPPATCRPPRVPGRGALVLAGGGPLDGIVERFVALAGGAEHARIVLLPAAAPTGGDPVMAGELQRLGVRDVVTLGVRHPDEVDDGALGALAAATGVWLGGGRQWRLVDAFEGTAVPDAIRGVLERGGVVGGTSAGATALGEFMVRGDPLGNTEMWCEGYSRGFGLLPGCAIDQHFVARQRLGDLQELVNRFPQVVGIGIDEGTAAVVTGDTLEVIGASKVAIVVGAEPGSGTPPPPPHWLAAPQQTKLRN